MQRNGVMDQSLYYRKTTEQHCSRISKNIHSNTLQQGLINLNIFTACIILLNLELLMLTETTFDCKQ